MNLKAVLFDVDGTLSETEEAHRAAFNETFQAEGLDWRWDRDMYRHLLSVTGGRERIRFFLESERPSLAGRREDDAGSEDWIARLHKDKTRRFGEKVSGGELKLRSGVERLIREAGDEGLRLAIATTTSRVNVDTLLANSMAPDAVDHFKIFATSESSEKKKPDPGVYLWALEQLDLPAQACIAIEDSENGLRAALAAGIPTVIATSPYTEGGDFTGALAVVDRLGEPDRPFRILHGETLDRTFVDVELLQHWHSQNTEKDAI